MGHMNMISLRIQPYLLRKCFWNDLEDEVASQTVFGAIEYSQKIVNYLSICLTKLTISSYLLQLNIQSYLVIW